MLAPWWNVQSYKAKFYFKIIILFYFSKKRKTSSKFRKQILKKVFCTNEMSNSVTVTGITNLKIPNFEVLVP